MKSPRNQFHAHTMSETVSQQALDQALRTVLDSDSEDVLAALARLGVQVPPTDNTQPDGNDDPSNALQVTVVPYAPPAAAPATVRAILDHILRNDLGTPFDFTGGVTIDAHSTHKNDGETALFEEGNTITGQLLLNVADWPNALATVWTKPDVWGEQFRRVISNEACVDLALMENVVEPTIAALEVYLATFLTELNRACKYAFGNDFEYAIQLRHECTTETGGRTDFAITLEHSYKGVAVEWSPGGPGIVPWSNADRFFARLRAQTTPAIKNRTDFEAEAASGDWNLEEIGVMEEDSIEARRRFGRWAPCIALHIIEDKMVGFIDPAVFVGTPPDPKAKPKNDARRNRFYIMRQLKRYCTELCCPWITLSDYFDFLTFNIPPSAIETKLVDSVGSFDHISPAPVLTNIFLNTLDANTTGRPRLVLFMAILKRLEAMGLMVPLPAGGGNLISILDPNPLIPATKPTLVVMPAGATPDLNENERTVKDALGIM
ncbi:hypothetical protein DL96DRAFT_1580207 [Flagelloscypha sp. PMI_526]|nr:hypothetical protein DL96DRAFT_1580207 [Flagelloscypha sp. PMI_526]